MQQLQPGSKNFIQNRFVATCIKELFQLLEV